MQDGFNAPYSLWVPCEQSGFGSPYKFVVVMRRPFVEKRLIGPIVTEREWRRNCNDGEE
jgi:hypothetical protein